MKYSKIILTLLFFGLISSAAPAQKTISLEQCENLTGKNYPLIRQIDLLSLTEDVQLEKVKLGNRTQMNLNGNISYQSDVVHFPLKIPNMEIPTLSKDQYRLGAELVQPLTGWLTTPTHQQLIRSNIQVEKEQVETQLYQLLDRVQQLYFAVLLADAQRDQADLLMEDLQTGLKKTQVAIANGVSLQSNADILRTEMLRVEQNIIEIYSSRKAALDMLSVLTGVELGEETVLINPVNVTSKTEINRPEIRLFDAQTNALNWKSKANKARTLPQAMVYLQLGYGKPGLNMLSNQWDGFYIGGIKLVWDINSFYDRKNEGKLINIQQQSVQAQKDIFLKNTAIEMKQVNSELQKIEKLIQKDKELINLRKTIKDTFENQLENGVITSAEYITQINAEDQARQNLALHQLQYLMAQYKLKRITN